MKKKTQEEPKEAKKLSDFEELQLLWKSVNKEIDGKGQVYIANEAQVYSRIPTGIISLDYITGGGLCRGLYHEFYGEESSGKTTASLEATAAVQRMNGNVVWVAREGFDAAWAKKRGVDLNKLSVINTLEGDKAMEVAMTAVEKGLVDLLVLDSIQAFRSSREGADSLDTESFGNAGIGQFWGRVYKRAMAAIAAGPAQRTAIIGISQVRAAIGKRGMHGLPPDPEPTGIWAIKHWKSMSIQFKKGEQFFEDEKSIEKKKLMAREFKVRCRKNKTSVSERTGTFLLCYEPYEGAPAGIDNAEALVRMGLAFEVLTPSGSWVQFGDVKHQSRAKFASYLRDNPKVLEQVWKKVLEATK